MTTNCDIRTGTDGSKNPFNSPPPNNNSTDPTALFPGEPEELLEQEKFSKKSNLPRNNTTELHDKIQAFIVGIGLCSFIACTVKPLLQRKLSPLELMGGTTAFFVGRKYVANLFIDESENTSKGWTTRTLREFTGYIIAVVVITLLEIKNIFTSQK